MSEHPVKKPKKVNARRSVRKKPVHILIVEDETAHADLIQRGLLSTKNPCRLSVAATLEEAREILAADQPDLMILDWHLPDGNGKDFLPENMRDICFPVIVMTSYGDEAIAEEILKAGAADYIVKSEAGFRNLPKIAQRAIRKWEIVKERKVAEKTLRESEERYRGVFENTGTATVIIEEDTTISFANDEFCLLSGCRKEEIEGRKQWTEFVVPEDLDQMLTQHRLRREQRQKAIRHYEFRFVTKSNQIRDIYLTIDVIRGTKQSVASLLDITERKAAEKLLRESEKKFHDTLLNLDEAFYSCTPEGVLLEHNPAFNHILGVDPGKDLRGTHLPDLWQRKHDRQKYLNELMNTGFVRNFLIDVKRHGGEKIVVMANSHLIRDEKNMPVRIDGTFLDITDRKRAEDALIRSESLLNQTQQVTKVGGWEYDVATGKMEWTSEAYRIYEVPADYDLNNIQQAVEFYAPEDRAIIKNAFLRAVEQGEPYDLELRFVGAKGTPKWVRTTAQVERISGKIIRVFGNIIDITDRKEAVEEVFHMAQEWQRTFDAANDAIWILSKDQRVLRSNKAAERFFERSCGELIGKNCWEIVHCTELPIPGCPFLRAKNSLARETMELQIDGDWLDVTVDPILDAAGEFAGAVHIITDITKRKRSEEALRVVQEKYTKAFLAAPDAITISELDSGRFVEVNEAAIAVFGYSREELIGKTALELGIWQKKEDRAAFVDQVREHGRVIQYEVIQRRKSGKLFYALVNTDILSIRGLNYLIAIIRDVTEQKRAEEELQKTVLFLTSMIEQSPVPMWISDDKGTLLKLNKACCDLLNITEDDVVGKYNVLKDNLVEEQGLLPLVKSVFEKGRTAKFEIKYDSSQLKHLALKKTTFVILDVTIFPIKDPEGRITNAVIQHDDITNRKWAEEELKKSQIQLAEAMDLAQLVNWEFDVPTGIFTFDDRFYALYGTTAEREGGNKMSAGVYSREFIHPDDQNVVANEVNKALQATDPDYISEAEHRIIRRDGDVRHILVRIGITKDAQGRTIKTHGVNQDITERKRAEDALRKSEEKFRSMVDASPDMIWEINRQGNFTYISSRCGVQLGYGPEDLIGKPFFLLIRPESVPEITTKFFAHIEDKSSFTTIEVPANRRNGSPCIIEIRSVPITGNEGQLAGFRGIARDITDRKRAEEAVRDSQKRVADIFSFLPDAVLAIDNEGRVIAWNKAMEEMTGVAAADMLGKSNYEYSIPFYGVRRPILIDLILTEYTEIEKKYLFVHRDGERIVSEAFIPEMNEGRGAHLWFIASPLYNTAGKRVGAIETIRDITERKQVEQALQESEERYRSVVEDQTELICRFTPDGRITFVNDAYCRYFSLDKNQCIAEPQSVMLQLEDARLMKRHIASLTQENPVAIIEHRIIMSSGEIRWQRWSDRAIFDKDGLLVEYQSVGRDITEKKRAEQSLQESEERYRSVVEDQTEFICRFTPDGRITFVNDAYCRYFSLDKNQCIAEPQSVMLLPEDARIMKRHIASLTQENPVAIIEHRIIMSSGEIRWQRWSDRAIFDKDGLLVEYQSVGRDITEKKQAEEELRDSEIRYRSVIENAAEGIVVIQDGIVQYANTRALEMVDLSPEEIGNQQFTGFIHPEDRALVFDRYQRRIQGENVPQNYDFRIVGKSGQITWVQVSAVQISWNNQPATLNFLMDITDRKLMDAEIRSLNRVLEQRVADRTMQLNAMLTEKELLLREIHHRVKNNLQIIVSLFNLQSRYISDQKVLDVIRESQNRVRAMALVHERIYRSENVASVDLKEYLAFLGEQVFHYHGVKPSRIKLCLTMPEIRMAVDTVIPLGLIVNELLSNSLKHAFPDGRKGTISILCSTCNEDISLSFSDDGIGFPAGLDWKNSPSLGLRLVISLVRQLNGKIELDPSTGTTFRITATHLQPGMK